MTQPTAQLQLSYSPSDFIGGYFFSKKHDTEGKNSSKWYKFLLYHKNINYITTTTTVLRPLDYVQDYPGEPEPEK